MEPANRIKILRRVAAVVVFALSVVVGVATWSYAGALRDELVSGAAVSVARDVEIVTVGSGRIVVARNALTESEGIWGVLGPNGYGQASVKIAMTDETVERAFRTVDGTFDTGELVGFDPVAYQGDPLTAHGIEFVEVRFTGDLGAYPAWVIDGDRDSWVIIVHGAGPGEREQALRIIPRLVAEGYPVMVITMRGDKGAPPSRTGRRALGSTEWSDVAAAVDYAVAQDAADLILLGFDTGAGAVAMYLHAAADVTLVRGAVFDSALLDPERIADRIASERGLPAPMRGAGKLLARLRFDIDWEELDQVARADEYTVPILLMHGTSDAVADVATAAEFAAALGDLAEYEEFEGAAHGLLWNADPVRYEQALLGFMERVTSAGGG